jgi:hypothetical protein
MLDAPDPPELTPAALPPLMELTPEATAPLPDSPEAAAPEGAPELPEGALPVLEAGLLGVDVPQAQSPSAISDWYPKTRMGRIPSPFPLTGRSHKRQQRPHGGQGQQS